MIGARIVEGGDSNEQSSRHKDPGEDEQMPGNQKESGAPKKCHEKAFLVYMRYFRDRMSIKEYMRLRSVSRQARDLAEDCIQVIAKKIKIEKRNDSIHQNIIIRTKDDREVLKAHIGDIKLTSAIRFFDKIGIRPIFLDLTEFNHQQGYLVMDALSAFIYCMKISRFDLMTDIFAISPAAFMENEHGVNSLTIDAELPKKCADLLKERSRYHIGVKEVFDVFCSSIHFFARVLFIKGTNKTHIEKRYFVAMMNLLRVEELIMYPESDEQIYQPTPGVQFASPYSDMKFAQLPHSNPLAYWDDSDEKIKLKVVSYTAVDRIPCTAVVEHVCSWFETSKEMLIIFPKPRSYKELQDDVGALCSYLHKFKYPLISIRFNVYRNANGFPALQHLFYEIRSILQTKGFLYSSSHLANNWFNVEVESDYFFKKLRVTEVDSPAQPPHLRPFIELVRADEEEAVQQDMVPGLVPMDLHEAMAAVNIGPARPRNRLFGAFARFHGFFGGPP